MELPQSSRPATPNATGINEVGCFEDTPRTFWVLLVALLQNSQSREDQATQHQLNAIADARADLVTRMSNASGDDEFRTDIAELRAAVGFEDKERSSNNTH